MKKLLLALLIVFLLATPVAAQEFTAPQVPHSAQDIMPENTETFSQGLFELLKTVMPLVEPNLTKAASLCLRVLGVVLLLGLVESVPVENKTVYALVAALAISFLLLKPADAMIKLGTETVQQLSEYGKLLLPVMTSALAAQGGVTKSAALCSGTVLFHSLLSSVIVKVIVPVIYIYLCACIANCALPEDRLKKMQDFLKWLMTWLLKTVLYVFTGYISITGVVSGSADAAAMKAAKLTISGVVPVVGNILSDASEAVLVSAGVMKSTAGIYGLLAMLALLAGPFLQIGAQYVTLKITAGICGIFGNKRTVELIQSFCGAMGLLLAMTGTMCLMQMISTVCFMKGVG